MSATELGWLGIWVFAGASAVIAIELAVMGIWSLRLARRGRALAVALQVQRGLVEEDMQTLRVALEEMRRLWRPYGRVLRWLRHPLVIALIGSYRARWASGRLL